MTAPHPDLSRRAFRGGLIAVLAVAALLRALYPAADPPWNPTVGIVWHDEGAWVHNARNKVLFGAWSQDAWNPMYVAPVFTGLEYLAFKTIGVGVRQARVVPEVAGLISVWLLALGVGRTAGRRAGLIAGALLATNYMYVMWNRAALMEAPMVAFMVASWFCYVRAETSPRWGWGASACALLAFFTKASAAFFVAALALDAVITLVLTRRTVRLKPDADNVRLKPDATDAQEVRLKPDATDVREVRLKPDTTDVQEVRLKPDATDVQEVRLKPDTTGGGTGDEERRAAWITLIALAVLGALALALFVLPHWTDYRFYNWQMSVVRKPSYSIKALADRVTGFPLHDLFTRMWFILVVAFASALGALARWRRIAPGERLLLLWIGLGCAELILHDVGNERRFIFFIPALVALAAVTLGRDRTIVSAEAAGVSPSRAWLLLPVILYGAYVVSAALIRIGFLYEVRPNVRLGAAVAVLFTAYLYATWPRVPRALSRNGWSPRAAVAITLLVSAGQIAQFVQWAAGRSYKNYEASIALGQRLPPGTLVHGKLANGLALENGIRPIFVGRDFGNYGDRKLRDDVRYILTYTAPSLGYESQAGNPVIKDVIDAYPNHRIVMTFDVAETATGHDRAALIDKFGGQELPQMSGRAKD
jgi:4-amino-4-deoxy-L-arabinose transferase-like glycosyltransferase